MQGSLLFWPAVMRVRCGAALRLVVVFMACWVAIGDACLQAQVAGESMSTPPVTQANSSSLPASVVPAVPPPKIAAESAAVVDLQSGRVIFAKNADQRRQVASTQKIMTALCTIEAGDLEHVVTIQPVDVNCEPTRLDIKPGETYTRRELLNVLLVKSANDVARALARDVAGSVEAFSDRMNARAEQLGMQQSHFRNPNGLPDAQQYSTARDMAIAARQAYRSPLIRAITRQKSTEFRYENGRVITLENTNRILKALPYCNGMKTGTTNAAGRCLVATGELEGRSVVVVVLKSTTPQVWSDAEMLMRWALERPGGYSAPKAPARAAKSKKR